MTRCLRFVLGCLVAPVLLLSAPAQTPSTPAQAPAKKTAAQKPAAKASATAAKTKKTTTKKTDAATSASGSGKAAETQAAQAQPAAPPDTIILKGAPMGGVKFLHTAHAKDRAIKCETCHHPAKAESPAQAAQQRCTDCHTTVAKAPMKTKRQAAFHNPTATAGVCIDCHKAQNAKGKKAPTKCMECHQKANA